MRPFLICLSLANLCLLWIWANLLPAAIGTENRYYLDRLPAAVHHPTALLNLVLLCALFWLVHLASRRVAGRSRAALEIGFLFFLMIPLNAVRLQLDALSADRLVRNLGSVPLGIFLAGAAALGIWLLLRRRTACVRAACAVLLACSPFALLTTAQNLVAWSAARPSRESSANKELQAVPLAGTSSNTAPLVWLLFDEADYELLFERSDNMEFPALARLKEESVFLTRAFPPASDTARSIPALLTGRLVARAEPGAPDELLVWFDGAAEPQPWSRAPSVFAAAKERGLRVGVAAWYHSYCEIFKDVLDACFRKGMAPALRSTNALAAFAEQWVRLAQSVPLVYRLSGAVTEHRGPHRRAHEEIERALITLAADEALDFLYGHLAVPHLPALSEGGYRGNLRLMDESVGRVRAALERAGRWDGATLIVTADHWYRGKAGRDHRVPLLIKLPHERAGAVHERPFNTVALARLLEARRRGEAASTATLLEWLDAHAADEGPYTRDYQGKGNGLK